MARLPDRSEIDSEPLGGSARILVVALVWLSEVDIARNCITDDAVYVTNYATCACVLHTFSGTPYSQYN